MLEDNKKNSDVIFNYYNIIQKFRSNEIFYRKDIKFFTIRNKKINYNFKEIRRHKYEPTTLYLEDYNKKKYIIKYISDNKYNEFPFIYCNGKTEYIYDLLSYKPLEPYHTDLKIIGKECENIVNIVGIYEKYEVEKYEEPRTTIDLDDKIKIKALSKFSNLIKKHKITKLDLLHIDAEGYDFEIIKTIKLQPKLILYEHLHLSKEDKKSCENLLKKQGYKLLDKYGDTLAFR